MFGLIFVGLNVLQLIFVIIMASLITVFTNGSGFSLFAKSFFIPMMISCVFQLCLWLMLLFNLLFDSKMKDGLNFLVGVPLLFLLPTIVVSCILCIVATLFMFLTKFSLPIAIIFGGFLAIIGAWLVYLIKVLMFFAQI